MGFEKGGARFTQVSEMSELQPVTRHTPFDALPQFLTVDEVSKWLAVGRTTAYEIAGKFGVRFGRSIRVPRESLSPHTVRALTASEGITSDDQEVQ